MAWDSPVELIQATVQLEQFGANGGRWVGTGFLVGSRSPDGAPRTILITANHVFEGMAGAGVRVGYRSLGPGGTWSYTPAQLTIRDPSGEPLWTRHPTRDVAAISIEAPPEFARAAIPLSYLASDRAPVQLTPGDELMVLGYPRGLAANSAGFPILRAGKVASYPTSPAQAPTFMLDFSVFPGNSGGPVFLASARPDGRRPATPRPAVAGILTQQVELNSERLDIGIVTHARYIIETVELLEHGSIPKTELAQSPPTPGAAAASQGPPAAPAFGLVHAWRALRLSLKAALDALYAAAVAVLQV